MRRHQLSNFGGECRGVGARLPKFEFRLHRRTACCKKASDALEIASIVDGLKQMTDRRGKMSSDAEYPKAITMQEFEVRIISSELVP